MEIETRGLSKSFSALNVFDRLDLSFSSGRITVLLGPSGCGKTTLLNIIAGTLAPDAGEISGIRDQRIAYIFQEPRLLPWLTVRGNIEFVLPSDIPKRQRAARTDHFLSLVGLRDFSSYYPDQLSGGMKQRVAIARAFAFPAEVLLMDEPFKGLDLGLKLSLFESFELLWREDPRTTVFVTHDIQEALLLGNEILVLSQAPMKVLRRIGIDLPKESRSLEDEQMLRLEKKLYGLFLHSDASR